MRLSDRRQLFLTLIAVATLSLAGCSKPPAEEDPAAVAARALALMPKDARLSELYQHSCRACHGVTGSGAPLAGDRAAWAPRRAKGEAQLLKSVVEGYRGMPAGGQCFACGPEDYKALVRFMSAPPKDAK